MRKGLLKIGFALVVFLVGVVFLFNFMDSQVQDWECNIQSYPEHDSLMPTENSTATGSMCASLVGECRHQESCRHRPVTSTEFYLIGLNTSEVDWYDE